MKRKQYLVKNTALFALNSIGTKLINFFLVPVYTAALTTSDYGTADLVSTVAMILVPIFTLNVGEAVMRFCLDDNSDDKRIMSVGVTVMAFSVVLGILVIPLASLIPNIAHLRIYISLYCISHGIYQISVCYLRGTERLAQYALSNIVHVFSAATLNIVLLLGLKMGLKGYFTAHILGYFIGAVVAMTMGRIHRVLYEYKFDSILARNMIKYSIVLVPTSFMWWIMNSSDRIMVTAMVGAAANGIYAISYKVPTVLSAMSTVFNQAWSYSAIKEDKSEDRVSFNNRMFDKIFRLQIILTTGLLMVIKPFIAVYVSDAYYTSWRYTPYLLIGFFFMSMGTFLSTSYTVNKDSKGFLKSGLSGAIMNVVLNWLFIPRIQTAGAALATCISYITVFLYRSIDTRKYLIIDMLKKEYIISVVLMFIMGVTVYLESARGQILLVCEFILIVLINRQFLIEMVTMIYGLIRKVLFKRAK